MFSYSNRGATMCGHWENEIDWLPKCTLQMAMAWLREKHIVIVIYPEYFNTEEAISYWGVDIWAGDNYENLPGNYPKYEEAVETALKYSLENLV